MDNPTDIPEFDERLFTNVYNFTIKLNYYMIKKLRGIITGIYVNMPIGMDVVQIRKSWLESQQKIITTFNQYVANASSPNPLINVTDYETLVSDAISALGTDPCVVLTVE
jgi:hypothetical protein